MCGILLLHGPRARERLAPCLAHLVHRGPDGTAKWYEGETAIGFQRLAITDKGPLGQQPFFHHDLVGAFNGEIYNHLELARRHAISIDGDCDIRVLLPLFSLLGPSCIHQLDGFYSGVILDRARHELLCLRDPMGKKPLLLGRSGSELFVTSELKALDDITTFQVLPKGLSRIDLETGKVVLQEAHQGFTVTAPLAQLVRAAVVKRLPNPTEPVGLFLSGGLDSSIVTALVSEHRRDAIHYTLTGPDSPDAPFIDRMVDVFDLGTVRSVPLPSEDELPGLISAVVRATESTNPSIISNGLCTYLLARAAHRDGVKVVLTGEGADELFCGYHRHSLEDPWRQTRARLIEDMHSTELRRLDSCCMAHAVEARCPFLDHAVRRHSDGLGYSDHFTTSNGEIQNKMALRRAFHELLPPEVRDRRKQSFDVGSGVRGKVVSYLRSGGRTERAALRDTWCRHFDMNAEHPWFHAYPVFDQAIDRRGVTHR